MSYTILVVDDSPLIRKMMKRTLGLSSLDLGTVYEATNGREALAVLEKEWIDVVLADIHMPVMTGSELIELMSRDELLGKIPVVVISAERSEPACAATRHGAAVTDGGPTARSSSRQRVDSDSDAAPYQPRTRSKPTLV